MFRLVILLALLAAAVAIIGTVIRDVVRRSRRRAAERHLEMRAQQRQQDALRLPGGTAENAVDIETPSVVETMAESEKCLRCAGDLRTVEHAAETCDGDRLRIARMKCARCGARRELFFRLQARQLH